MAESITIHKHDDTFHVISSITVSHGWIEKEFSSNFPYYELLFNPIYNAISVPRIHGLCLPSEARLIFPAVMPITVFLISQCVCFSMTPKLLSSNISYFQEKNCTSNIFTEWCFYPVASMLSEWSGSLRS
jgi:hypothetical protein